jgi:glycosyltransferase involved in cell wall biosynthesis
MNEKDPTVSVVIPLYNKEKYIKRALFSVLAQTSPPLETIVVDDGSTDDGPEKVKSFNNPNIILIRQENKGPGAARNAGLAKAKGKYITFLDADDEWMPQFLETGLSFLEENANVSVVCIGYYYYPELKRSIIWNEQEHPNIFEINETTDVETILRLITVFLPTSTIIKTDVVRKWGGFYNRYKCIFGEDLYLFYKIMFNERIGIIPKALAIYHTDASDLYAGGKKKDLPIPPYLEDPNDILLSCPLKKRIVLQKLLLHRAMHGAKSFAFLGHKKKAKELFNRFYIANCLSFSDTLRIRMLISFAPLLPTMRILWRFSKFLMRRNSFTRE